MAEHKKFKFDLNSSDPCNIVGKVFGKITVLEYVGHYRDKKGVYRYWYKCQCACRLKTVKLIPYNELATGNTTSCGMCKRSEPILPGDKFGDLTVIEVLPPKEGSKHSRALCECSCPKHTRLIVDQTRLRTGNTRTCGDGWHYLQKEYTGKLKIGPLPGTDIEILEISEMERTAKGERVVLCKCHHINPISGKECGKIFKVAASNLVTGNTKTCGCSHNIYPDEKSRVLGSKWFGMKARCNIPTSQSYEDYGGRGIKICDEWDETKAGRYAFIRDGLARGFKIGDTIDRIDNDSGYSPNNIRYVGMDVQLNNTRNNHYITVDGVKKSAADWARTLGVDVTMFTNKLRATKDDAEFVRRLRDGREIITDKLSYDLCNKKKTRIDKGTFRVTDTLTIDGVTKTYPEWELYYHTYQHFIKRRLQLGYTKEEIVKSLKQFCTAQRFRRHERLFTIDGTTLGITGWMLRLNVPRTLLQSKFRNGGEKGLVDFVKELNTGLLTVDGQTKTFRDWEREYKTYPGFCYRMFKMHNGDLTAVIDELKYWKQTRELPM